MKLFDYLSKRKRYKELRRQLRKVRSEHKTSITTFGLYSCVWDHKTQLISVERITNQEKQIEMLEKELREIFKE